MNATEGRQPSLRKPLLKSLKWGLVILLLVVLPARVWWGFYRGWTPQQLQKNIQREVAPACQRQEVEEWFDGKGIEHIYVEEVDCDQYSEGTAPVAAGLRETDLSGMVIGHLEGKDVRSGLFEYNKIRVYFFFDKQGRLAGHYVRRTVHSF